MRATFMLLLPLLFLVQGTAAFAADAEDRVITRAVEAFRQVMGGCPQKIWPGYSWKNLDVALLKDGAKEHLVLSLGRGRLEKISAGKISESSLSSAYDFLEVNGRAVMTLNVSLILRDTVLDGGPPNEDEALRQVFVLGVHEAFHELMQRGWKVKEGGERGTEIPILHKPRIQRRMLFDRMRSALLRESGQSALGQAGFWFHSWKKEFPTEALSTTDGYEGTARFAEYFGELLRLEGCAAADETLEKRLQQQLRAPDFGNVFEGEIFSLDGEGYEIGALAAFLLRFQGGGDKWQARMAEGITPPEVLFSSRAALADQVPEALERAFRASGERLQAKALAEVGETLALWNDPAAIRVGLSGDWHEGSEELADTYVDRGLSLALTKMGGAEVMKSSNGQSRLEVSAGAVFVEKSVNPCKAERIFLFAPALAREEGGWLNVNAEKLKGRLKVLRAKGATNWFCANVDRLIRD